MTYQTCGQLIKAALAANPGKTKKQLAAIAGVSIYSASLELDRLRKAGLAKNEGRVGPIAIKWYPLPDPPNLDDMAPEYIKVSSIWRVGQRFAAQEASYEPA
jgi:hypothetical protein